MAVQDLEDKKVKGTKGKERGINKGAVGMVMDIVQTQQYQKPTESTVRELTANAVDSQSEKERAFEILRDGVSPDKYFVKREGALYENSNWNADYYDLNKLDSKNNNVELTYKRGTGGGRCDTFMVKDYGVGIGSDRLEGVLEIGYSTKRNRKDALGAFGIGAKVGLATGADYYTITSVYNGVKHIIKVFDRKINSLVGALNLETGGQNVPYTFSDGEVIYGEKTDEKNYTTIEVPAMKHHRDDYIRAVETQLLYFTNVKFFLEDEDGYRNEKHFTADVLHNSPNLIISTNSPYSKPHIVIIKGGNDVEKQTGVCYGYIDFAEMELQDMRGDIGIKCPIRQVMTNEDGDEVVINEGVDVVPSREAVRWTANTREFLKKQFVEAQDEASGLIEKELAQTDFIKWLAACKNITSYTGNNNTALGRLSHIVDTSAMRPRFNKTQVQFTNVSSLFKEFKVVTNTKYLDKGEKKYKVRRESANGWGSVRTESLFFKTINARRHTDCYLADAHNGTFTTIAPMTNEELETEYDNYYESENRNEPLIGKDATLSKKMKDRDHIINLLKLSADYADYDTVSVPDSYISTLEESESDEALVSGGKIVLSAADKRKLEERVVCNTFVPSYMDDDKTYKKAKREPKYQEVLNYKGKLYYGSASDESKLQFACHILDLMCQKKGSDGGSRFYNESYKIVLVAQNNKKHFATHSHIDDFFGKSELVHDNLRRIVGTKIVMDNALVQWNTARKMSEYMNDLDFMKNFSNFDEEVKKDFDEIKRYVDYAYTDLTGWSQRFGMREHYGDFMKFIENVEKVQSLAESNVSAADMAEEVKALSLPTSTMGGLVVNTKMILMQDKLRAYAGPIKVLLNAIPAMTGSEELALELEMIIKEFITWKGEAYVKEEEVEEEAVVDEPFEFVKEEV